MHDAQDMRRCREDGKSVAECLNGHRLGPWEERHDDAAWKEEAHCLDCKKEVLIGPWQHTPTHEPVLYGSAVTEVCPSTSLICEHCGSRFFTTATNAHIRRYCSMRCYDAAHDEGAYLRMITQALGDIFKLP